MFYFYLFKTNGGGRVDISVLNDHTRPQDPFKNLFPIYKYRTSGQKSSGGCHLVKKKTIKGPRTSMACGDAD